MKKTMKPLLPASVVSTLSNIASGLQEKRPPVARDIEERDAVFRLALAHADYSSRELEHCLQRSLNRTVHIDVIESLSRHQILTFEERRRAGAILRDHNSSLNILMSPPDAELRLEALRRLQDWQQFERNRALVSVITRLMLLDLADRLRASESEDDQRAGSVIAEILARTFANESREIFAAFVRMLRESAIRRTRPSMSERLADMIREASDAALARAQGGESTTIESVTAENSDLRASLFGIRHELELLQEQMSTLQTSSAETSTARFLAEINASTSGALLDNLMHSSRVVKQLLASGWQPQPIEVEGVIYTLTMLTDHLQRIGLTPMHEIGTTLEISFGDLENFEYAGSEFMNGDERKSVRVRSPGWRYQDQIVTRPRVVEAPTQA